MSKVFVIAAVCIVLVGCGRSDAEANKVPVKPSIAPTQSADGWRLARSKDDLTDEPRVIASLPGLGDGGSVSVHVRCMGKDLDVLVAINEYLGNDRRPVQYRFDRQELLKENWMVSSKGTAIYADNERDFARQLLSSKKLIVEVGDFRDVPHRATFEWSSGEDRVREVLHACTIPEAGLSAAIPGLRKEVAREMERWGPRNIRTNKSILAQVDGYNGPMDSMLNPEFAIAAQSNYDKYIAKCKQGKVNGTNCTSLKIFWSAKVDPVMPPVGAVLYEQSSGALKKEAGSLRVSD